MLLFNFFLIIVFQFKSYRALYILVKHSWEDSKLQNFVQTDLHFKVVEMAVLGEITQNY